MGGVQAWQPHHREPTGTERSWLQQNLGRVELDVSAVLESRLLTSDLLAIAEGDVISLGVPTDLPIDVRVSGTLKFKGRLGVAGRGQLGVWIDRCCDASIEEDAR
jgi:flagellar motor switch protein FliM